MLAASSINLESGKERAARWFPEVMTYDHIALHSTTSFMQGQNDSTLHWNQARTAYTCRDLVGVLVRKRTFVLERKYMNERNAHRDYLYGNVWMGFNNVLYGRPK